MAKGPRHCLGEPAHLPRACPPICLQKGVHKSSFPSPRGLARLPWPSVTSRWKQLKATWQTTRSDLMFYNKKTFFLPILIQTLGDEPAAVQFVGPGPPGVLYSSPLSQSTLQREARLGTHSCLHTGPGGVGPGLPSATTRLPHAPWRQGCSHMDPWPIYRGWGMWASGTQPGNKWLCSEGERRRIINSTCLSQTLPPLRLAAPVTGELTVKIGEKTQQHNRAGSGAGTGRRLLGQCVLLLSWG